MKMSVFKRGLTIEKLQGYLDLMKEYSVDMKTPLGSCFTIEDLSTDEVQYKYFCAFAIETVKRVYFLRYEHGLYGLSYYDLYDDCVVDVTPCEYNGSAQCICYDCLIFRKPIGVESVIMNGVLVTDSLKHADVMSLYDVLFVIAVTDMTNEVHYYGYTVVDDDVLDFGTVNDFFEGFADMVWRLRDEGMLDNATFSDLDNFRANVAGRMCIDDFV